MSWNNTVYFWNIDNFTVMTNMWQNNEIKTCLLGTDELKCKKGKV